MENVLYWIWLSVKKNIAAVKINALLEHFGTVEDIYKSRSFNNIRGISDKERAELMDKDLTQAKQIAYKTEKIGAKIIVYDSEQYPQLLKNIPDPPYVLYVLGRMPMMDSVLTIGVVGTRNCSRYGRLVTERLCRALASAGVVTIGGMARGIDTVGAWATLDAGGCSVGVIGSGLDVIYPPENGELMRAVTARGCIISEYPPGSPPTSSHFPHRNRIIAGLSRGVLVTEAPQKSGALITAQYALENNRDVFAVPRSLTDKNFLGTNLIIQQGAKLINNPNDILCEYPYAERVEIQKTKIKPVSEVKAETQSERAEKKQRPKEIKMELSDERYNNLNEKEKEIINVLKKKDTQIDEISRGLDISVSEVNTHLVLLEMKGLVKKLPGSTYQLKL